MLIVKAFLLGKKYIPTVRHKRKDPFPEEREISEDESKSVPVKTDFVKTRRCNTSTRSVCLTKALSCTYGGCIGKRKDDKVNNLLLSSVASAMLVHKRCPTHDDYVGVARTFLQKYSFMASPVGTPYVSNNFVYLRMSILFWSFRVHCDDFDK